MSTLEEKVAVLSEKVNTQEKRTEDQEERLRSVEEFAGVVTTLRDTVEKQGENIDKVTDAIRVINEEKAKTDGLMDFIKSIKPKDIILFIVALALIFSMITGQKVNNDTLKQITTITNQLELEGVIDAD